MPGERGLTFNFYDGVDLRAAGEGDMASPQASILAHSTLAAVAAQILSNILAELEEQIDTKWKQWQKESVSVTIQEFAFPTR